MKKRLAALLLAVIVTFSAILAGDRPAAADSGADLVVTQTTLQNLQMVAGGSVHVKLSVRLKDAFYVMDPRFTITTVDGAPLLITNITTGDASNPSMQASSITNVLPITLEYDIAVDDYAKIGSYKYTISYTGTTVDGLDTSGTLDMKVNVIGEKIPPQISIISNTEFTAKAGEEVTMRFTIRNEGEIKALNTYVAVDFDDSVMIPTYTPLKQKIGDITSKATQVVTVSYTIADDAKTQKLKLPLVVTYKNANGEEYNTSEYSLYLNIIGEEVEQETSTLLLNSVSQYPSKPTAGENIKVSFALQNLGASDITEVKVSATGLSATGFEPIDSEPYQYVGTVPGNGKVNVDLNLKVGKDIQEGLNTLNVQYSYVDGNGVSKTETTSLYILDVQNPTKDETVISRPKLMVSNFYTDVEDVKAGNTFDFTFEVFNTNSDINAKNIKLTVTSTSGNFSVTSGGNSFFVNEIKAGETEAITINLKASAASTTGAYPIDIKMEYEYDGMVATTTYEGEVVNEQILLQVKENLRPSVENVYVGGWETPIVNQSTPMNFEFYNMGKSVLNNTYVTIEGDFMLGNGSNSYYIGNISAGMPEYVEFDVVPLVEGNAIGKMTIHMEDSNGDEVTMEKEFTAYIEGETSWEDPGNWGTDPSVPTDTEPVEVVEPIIPLWIFLCIQAGILVVVIPVTRKIRLVIYRNKVRKEDEAN